MSVQGPFPVDCSQVFPFGIGIVGEVVPMINFEQSTADKKVQARDRETNLPLWQVDVMDFDPEARERTFKVKIAASEQPVPPAQVGNLPVRPVTLEGMTVTPYLKDVGNGRQRIAYSIRAAKLVPPPANREHKAA